MTAKNINVNPDIQREQLELQKASALKRPFSIWNSSDAIDLLLRFCLVSGAWCLATSIVQASGFLPLLIALALIKLLTILAAFNYYKNHYHRYAMLGFASFGAVAGIDFQPLITFLGIFL